MHGRVRDKLYEFVRPPVNKVVVSERDGVWVAVSTDRHISARGATKHEAVGVLMDVLGVVLVVDHD